MTNPIPANNMTVTTPAKVPTQRELVEQLRRERIPFSGKDKKLQAYTEKLVAAGWHCHWFNDTEGRIARALQAGYQHVAKSEVMLNPSLTPLNNDPGELVRVAVGGDANGQPLYAYLMKLPEELWQEDQAAQQAGLDEVDKAISRGVSDPVFEGNKANQATAYAPPNVIKKTTSFAKPATQS